MLNLFSVVVLHGSVVNWLGGPSALGICAFFSMLNLFGVVALHGSMVYWWGRESICLGYMWILLYVKLMQCNGVTQIYVWLTGGCPSVFSICACFYMLNLFSVVVLHGSMVYWWGGSPSALSICAFFCMWNLFGVVVLHGSMVNWQRDPSALGLCAFFYMLNLYGVVVSKRSMLKWRKGWGQSAMMN